VATITRVEPSGELGETLAQYSYGPHGDLIAHTDVLGHQREFAYTQHLLTRYTDFNGSAVNLDWDWPGKQVGSPAPADAKVVREDHDGHDELRFVYHRGHWYTKVIDADADGNATFHRYDYHNRIILVEHPDGSSERYQWDDNNQLVGIRNAQGLGQRFEYDSAGQLIAVTDALGNTTRTKYNAAGLPVKLTNAVGDTTLTDYDEQGRPTAVTDAAGRTTAYRWNGAGRLAALIDLKGNARKFIYDNHARLIEARDCSGHATRYSYDHRGYLLQRTDAEGHATAYRHDARGQLLGVRHPHGVTEAFNYDGEGNLLSHTDGAGQVTRYAYNANGQPISRSDAAGRHLRYGYDKQWRLIRLLNESGEVTRFSYAALVHLSAETGFDGCTIGYSYDAAGRLAATLEGTGETAIATTYERDPLGRLTQRKVTGPDGVRGAGEEYFYDNRGRLTTARNDDGAMVRLHYDDAGNLVAEEQSLGLDYGGARYLTVTRHEYDALGLRTRTTLPNTRSIDWLRYGSGHVHGVQLDGQPLLDFERDKLHRETGRSHRGTEQRRSYDPAGRLAQLTARPAGLGDAAIHWTTERSYQYNTAVLGRSSNVAIQPIRDVTVSLI
jgi:YD repeat-containing protein